MMARPHRRTWLWRAVGVGLIAVIALALRPFIRDYFFPPTVHPIRGEIVQAVYGIGIVKPRKRYELRVGAPSKIVELYVEAGAIVQKDMPLVHLWWSGDLVFKAPFTGAVTALNFKPHEIVMPGQTVLILTNLEDRYLQIAIEQNEAMRIKPGQAVLMNFSDLFDQPFKETIALLYPTEDRFFVEVDIDTLPISIVPGMSSSVSIEIARKADALLLPRTVVKDRTVTVLETGKRRTVRVQTGLMDEEMVEITSDNLSVNDKVLVK